MFDVKRQSQLQVLDLFHRKLLPACHTNFLNWQQYCQVNVLTCCSNMWEFFHFKQNKEQQYQNDFVSSNCRNFTGWYDQVLHEFNINTIHCSPYIWNGRMIPLNHGKILHKFIMRQYCNLGHWTCFRILITTVFKRCEGDSWHMLLTNPELLESKGLLMCVYVAQHNWLPFIMVMHFEQKVCLMYSFISLECQQSRLHGNNNMLKGRIFSIYNNRCVYFEWLRQICMLLPVILCQYRIGP